MIRFYHVTKRYDNRWPALQDISLRVDKGEMAFLTGPTGAGKSTLLKLVFGAERADEGQILVAGWDIARLKRKSFPFLRRNIGVVFQDYKLIPRRTVFDNVGLALRVSGVPAREIARRVDGVLTGVGLLNKRDDLPLHLSGGEQQRIAIARALVHEPTILLADEPTGNLDPKTSWSIIDLFKDANARGTTVLIATHNREIVTSAHRRVIALETGHVVQGGEPE